MNFRQILLIAYLSAPAIALHATVTTTNLWRLGENDPGAVSGNTVNGTTIASIGGINLQLFGSGLTYTNAVAAPGSTLGVNFGGSGGYMGSVPGVLSGIQTNWGMQIWAKATNTAGVVLIYLGNTSTSGMGIFESSGWAVLMGGVVLQGNPANTVNTGAWTNLALVMNTTSATLYINGVAADTINAAPNPVSGNMMIGQSDLSTARFVGNLDEARIFTFAPGQFNVSDLNPPTSVPAVPALSEWSLALTLLLIMASGIWFLVRPDRRKA